MVRELDFRFLRRWLLAARVPRAYPFADEPIVPEMDPLAWMTESGEPLDVLAGREWPGAPEAFVLALLQGRFKRLLEAFLNGHDLGLDGRQPRPDGGFFPYEMDLEASAHYASYLVGRRFELDQVAVGIDRLAATHDAVAPADVAQLLAAFYRALPGCVDRVPSDALAPRPMPALHPFDTAGATDAVGDVVADFAAWARTKIAWAVRSLSIHGSLATADYARGFSDFDTFAIVGRDVCASAEALVELRQQLIGAWSFFYRFDPLQHHGVLLAAEQDLDFYGAASFPLEILDHAREVLGSSEALLRVRERPSAFEARSALAQMAQYFRQHYHDRSRFDRAFDLRYFAGMVLLAPAVYCQAVGRPVYKRDSFDVVRGVLSPAACRHLDRFSLLRAQGALRVDAGLDAPPPDAAPSDVAAFHARVLSLPSPPEASRLLGDDFVDAAHSLVEELWSAADSRPDSGSRPQRTGALPGFRFLDPPVAHARGDYDRALAAGLALIRELGPDVEAARFGSIGSPGISDIDVMLLVPPGADVGALDTLPTRWAGLDPDVRELFFHPPPIVARLEHVARVPELYPIAGWTFIDPQGTEGKTVTVAPGSTGAQPFLALAEIAILFFLRDTLPVFLRHTVDERFLLMRLAGLRHSVAVLSDAGIRVDGSEAFASSIAALRRDWFQVESSDRRRRLVDVAREGLLLQLGMLSGIAMRLRESEPSCAAVASAPGRVVGVLDETLLFVSGWSPELCLEVAERGFRITGRIFVALPAELAILPASLRAAQGPLQANLDGRFICAWHPDHVGPDIERRRHLIETQLDALGALGLHWGALPHWDFDPMADQAVPAPWHPAATALVEAGDLEALTAYLDRCGPRSPALAEARRQIESGQAAHALHGLLSLVRIEPENAEAHYLLACVLGATGHDRVRAIMHFDRALAGGFSEFWVRFQRAAVLRQLGRPESAVADLERAVELEPRNAVAAAALVEARRDVRYGSPRRLLAEGRLDEAAAAIRVLLTASPGDGEAHYLLGCVQAKAGEIEGAIESFGCALDGGFDEFWVRYQRGLLHATRGATSLAEADLVRATELAPSHAAARDALERLRKPPVAAHARELVDAERFEEAATELRLLTVSHPDDAEAHYLLAVCEETLGNREAALPLFERALRLGFTEFWIRLHRSDLLRQCGRLDEALADAERAVALEPQHAVAQALERASRAALRSR